MVRLLEAFVTQVPGYWRVGEEDTFPWHSRGSIWYALLVLEGGRIERYGFTSSGGQKAELCAALRAIPEMTESLLIGVWPGQNGTHLFVLDREKAIAKLAALP